MTDLSLPVEKLKNVGTRNAPRLHRLGVKTLKDILWHFPTRYEDYSETVPISDITPDQKVNIQGEIVKITTKKLFPRRMFITDAIVKDLSGAIRAVWFNQPFIENQLPEGAFVSLAGKVKTGKNGTYLSSPTYERITDYGLRITDSETENNNSQFAIRNSQSNLKHTKGLVPVYPETEGITSKYLRFLIKPLLSDLKIPDPVPEMILKKHGFPALAVAIKNIHFPNSEESAQKAKERLAFDDLMLFQIKALLERRKLNQLKSASIPFNEDLVKSFIADLPFELTKDQKIAAWEILKDLEKKYPMNRLMEGDVGSGKTVVALIAALEVVRCGYQVVIMAPTEVLAQQHYKTISELTANHNLKIGLLTSSTAIMGGKKIKKAAIKNELSKREPMLLIDTHAVISARGGPASGGQKPIDLPRLALVILDEQHRFGVQQRASLVKSQNNGFVPHLLSMTATPIPRTLALTIYGDLDISIIREKPKNRQKIVTKIIGPAQRRSAYQFVREEVSKGKQVFVVCPRIAASKNGGEPHPKGMGTRQEKLALLWQEVKAVEEEYKKLSQEIFPDLKVAMLHGKLKPKEKNKIMSDFSAKGGSASDVKDGIDILVSTSVIEVGVDIPNATIMMVESAERFGLAQLHQFRGRVGRSEHQSYCLLFSSSGDKSTNQRLKALVNCDDGFELAEKDMTIRGPGEFIGTKQSGMPDLAMASLANIDLIKKARTEARLLLKEDPSLTRYPLLKERLNEFQKMTHFE